MKSRTLRGDTAAHIPALCVSTVHLCVARGSKQESVMILRLTECAMQDKYGCEETLDPKDYSTSPRVLAHDALAARIGVPADIQYAMSLTH